MTNGSLYTRDILRLATLVPDCRLDDPTGSAEARSPTCGSRIIVDVRTGGDGQVVDYGHHVRACALGQASAAIVARGAIGCTIGDLDRALTSMEAFLDGSGPLDLDWPDVAHLAPARDYPARHGAILLPFRAIVAAAKSAQKTPAQ